MQHYPLYKLVEKDSFKAYIRAQNKAAAIPSIIPAVLLLVSTLLLLFFTIHGVAKYLIGISFFMNIVNVVSTALFQGRTHSRLEQDGFNKELIETLLKTNWIRTSALFLEAIVTVYTISSLANPFLTYRRSDRKAKLSPGLRYGLTHDILQEMAM